MSFLSASSPQTQPAPGPWTIIFTEFPTSLVQMQALPEASLTQPYHAAALTVIALCNYPVMKDVSIEMLNFLKGPSPLSPRDIAFLNDRFMDAVYIPASYFAGATPENAYIPSEPFTLHILTNPYSYAQLNEGYVKLFIQSGGADSPRPITMRLKPSTGQWYLWEQSLLPSIRPPVTLNPWA